MSGQRSAKVRTDLGIPDNFKAWSAFPFSGINQSASRIAMDDKEFFWLENIYKIGNGNLRALWDVGSSIYTAVSKTIVYHFFYNIGSSQYVALFFSDGTAFQVNTVSFAVTTISATAGLFYNVSNGQSPICSQSGAQYLLIANRNTINDYWIWDGTLLYSAGTLAPFQTSNLISGGSGYVSTPSYTVFGGTGSGVTLVPVIANGSVVNLTITSPGTGYLPGQTVQVAFSGGGTNSSPELTANLTGVQVQFITIVAAGSSYPVGTFTLGVSGGSPTTAATGTFTVNASGMVASINITSGGGGYISAPTITFPIPGSGGSITCTVSGGAVQSPLTIAAGGSGYTPGTFPLTFTGGGGSGASGTFTVNGSGVIASTTLVSAGTGYTTAPTIGLNLGSGASAVASLSSSGVASVNIIAGGTGLTGTPTLTFVGGGGSGAAGVATVSGGAISGVTITAAGSGYTTAPAVVVSAGLNSAAAATLTLMPFGVSGTSLETYQQRVFLGYPDQSGQTFSGGAFFVSAPGSLTNFATSAGGDIFNNTDRFLRQNYVFFRQTSNFLYAAGDSSVSVISNVQTTANSNGTSSTTFSYQNTDPQIGTAWRDTAQDFGNTILFANPFGIYGIYGGSVRKVSQQIDEIFNMAVLPPTANALTPTAAVANIYGTKVYLLLLTITDPFTSQARNVILMWNEREWFIATQTPSLVSITTQEVNSNLTAWGTDGTKVYPLFQTPSTLTKKISTKLYGGNEPFFIKMLHTVYIDAIDRSAAQTGIVFNSATVDSDGLAIPFVNSVSNSLQSCPAGSYSWSFQPTFTSPYPLGGMYATGRSPQVPGVALGLTMTSQSTDFVLRNLTIGYIEYAAVA